MHDDVNDSLDSMLASHLRRELDPHLGTVMRKLDAELAAPAATIRPASLWLPRVRYAAAVALMLSVGVVGSMVYRTYQTDSARPIAVRDASVPFTDAVQSSWTQTYDQGTVMVDPQTPARMIRRVQYQKTDWKDQTGQWQSRIDIPNQDVILVDMPRQ